MYQNIFKSLIAVASLAMMATADSITVKEVTPSTLYRMNYYGYKYYMKQDETLSFQMDTAMNGEELWSLASPPNAPYTILQHWECEDSACKIIWDINYDYDS